MVSRTNINAAEWPDDWYLNADVLRDLNSEEQAIRDVMIDIYGITDAYIFAGLTVEDGATPDTFKINAGRCRDYLKYHIVIPNDIPGEPSVDVTGAWNYIAVRHIWNYSLPRPPAKGGAAYNAVRSDGYEINVALVAHAEAAGWVRLARARKIGGVWEYDHLFAAGDPNYGRSREAEAGAWVIDFSYLGVPAAPTLMNRHTIVGGPPGAPTGDLWPVPFDFLVCRVEARCRVVSAADLPIELWRNGTNHIAWPAGGGDLVLAIGALNAIWWDKSGEASGGPVQYYKGNLIQVNLAVGLAAPTDITVTISGLKTGAI